MAFVIPVLVGGARGVPGGGQQLKRGWAGSVQTVRRYVAPFRKTDAAPEPPPSVPKTRQITRLLADQARPSPA